MKLVFPVGKDVSTFLTEANANCGCYCTSGMITTANNALAFSGCACQCVNWDAWSSRLNSASTNH